MTMCLHAATVVLEAAIRSVPLLLVAIAVSSALRGSAPGLRHLILAIGLIGTLAMPFVRPLAPSIEAPLAAASTLRMRSTLAGGAGTMLQAWTAIWIIGLAGSALRIARAAASARRITRTSPRLDSARWQELLEDVCAAAGLRQRPELREGAVATPMTCGVTRPAIVLPTGCNAWTSERCRAILLHEAAHIARADNALLWLSQLALAIYWFNPLAWILTRTLRLRSEEACDAAVLRAGVRPELLAADLLAVARGTYTRLDLASGAAAPPLHDRIRALFLARKDDRSGSRRSYAGVCLAGTAFTLLIAGVRPPAAASLYARIYGIPPVLAQRIIDAAREERVDEPVAFALVRVESDFRVNAVSRHGAVGLTQVLPSTARALAGQADPHSLSDATTNLRVGFRVLRRHLDRYGEIRVALAAYASGEREIDRLRAAGRPIPDSYSRTVLAAAIR